MHVSGVCFVDMLVLSCCTVCSMKLGRCSNASLNNSPLMSPLQSVVPQSKGPVNEAGKIYSKQEEVICCAVL
jgi:hypothetical protein